MHVDASDPSCPAEVMWYCVWIPVPSTVDFLTNQFSLVSKATVTVKAIQLFLATAVTSSGVVL